MSITPLAAIAIDVLYAQFPQVVQLRRSAPGAYVDGRWIEGAAAPDTDVAGCFWDMLGDEQRSMRDEQRRDDMRIFWTREVMKIRGLVTEEDKLVYRNEVYDVIELKERFEGAYYRVVVGRNHERSNSINV